MSRIVVTGGAGFVGSHICEALLARGDSVVAVDNFSTSRKENVEHLIDHAGFDLVVADVVAGIPVEGRVDGVLHLASPASPPEYLAMPLETLDVSSIGTRKALDLARAYDATFLLASTSEIYAIRSCTLRPRVTSVTSTPSARGRSTTRPSASARRSP